MTFLHFFLFLWVIFAFLDPDPDQVTQINADPSEYGSGSATLLIWGVWSGSRCINCATVLKKGSLKHDRKRLYWIRIVEMVHKSLLWSTCMHCGSITNYCGSYLYSGFWHFWRNLGAVRYLDVPSIKTRQFSYLLTEQEIIMFNNLPSLTFDLKFVDAASFFLLSWKVCFIWRRWLKSWNWPRFR